MADVYCAEDTHLGRQVALKVLYRRFAQDDQFVERFKREAQSAAGLAHPNVVNVYDRGEHDGTYYIAMEYLPGQTLKEVVSSTGPLEQEAVVDIGIQILRAASFAHRRGVVHRDLKPHNVMLDDAGLREGHRLRHRPRGRLRDDGGRVDHGDRAVPVARAGAGAARHRPVGPLFGRDHPVRAADRPAAVRRRERGCDRGAAPERRAAADRLAAAGRRTRTRGRRDASAGEGPGRPVGRRGRVHPGARGRSRSARRGAARAGHGRVHAGGGARPGGVRGVRRGGGPGSAVAVDRARPDCAAARARGAPLLHRLGAGRGRAGGRQAGGGGRRPARGRRVRGGERAPAGPRADRRGDRAGPERWHEGGRGIDRHADDLERAGRRDHPDRRGVLAGARGAGAEPRRAADGARTPICAASRSRSSSSRPTGSTRATRSARTRPAARGRRSARASCCSSPRARARSRCRTWSAWPESPPRPR